MAVINSIVFTRLLSQEDEVRGCRGREGRKERSTSGDATPGEAEAVSSNNNRAGRKASGAGRGAVGSTVMPQQNVAFICYCEVTPAPSGNMAAMTRVRFHVMNATELADRWLNSVLIKGANDECSAINEGREAGARRQTRAEVAVTCTDG